MSSSTDTELFKNIPDEDGRFGIYGGKYVSETLMSALAELERVYRQWSRDEAVQRELDEDLAHYVGRLRTDFGAQGGFQRRSHRRRSAGQD